MTAQVSEHLVYEGKSYALCSFPLEGYFTLAGHKPEFERPHTACWRGYVGRWEVLDRRLYLVGLQAWLKNGDKVTGTDFLFPGFPERVFAHWCNDILRIPQGQRLKYVHMGFGSEFERDLLLTFRRGILVETAIKVNGTADPDAPNGYSVAALTAYPKSKS